MSKLKIDLLNTSFTIQANENEDYLKKMYDYYCKIISDLSVVPSIKTPLQKSILAGIMLCDELYKAKSNFAKLKNGQELPPENNTDGEELERRTIAMIDKINKVL